MAKRKRKKARRDITTASGGCRFGKVKSGPRKGRCRKQRVGRRKRAA
jgi:hypothetical protein